MLRILELVPASGLLRAERVCHSWREAVASLPLWDEWRARGAELSEHQLSLPGVVSYAFGALPAEVSAESRVAAAGASVTAAELHASCLEIAPCSSSWSVLQMDPASSSTRPSAVKQHQSRDYMIAACTCDGLVFSGDKEAALRVWGARSGELLARVSLPGGSMSSLAAAHGRVFVGDSQGVVQMLSTEALLNGQLDSVSWRAHDAKCSALHVRAWGDVLLTGGSDGWVRTFSLRRLTQQAAMARRGANADGWLASDAAAQREVGASSGASRVDLGLWGVSESRGLVRHTDTVIALARDDDYAFSASREGHVKVSGLNDGVLYMNIPANGNINCLAAHRAKLVLCSDDGQQATISIWDVTKKELVQQLGGIRKWNAPTAICYMGYGRCMWVRDTTLCTMTWRAAPVERTAEA